MLQDDLAEFLLQLWSTAAPSVPEQTCLYSAWLMETLDRGLQRTLNGTARWSDAIRYLIMIPDFAEFDEYTGVGFAHEDLNAYNIMINDDFHLTGVIYWD
ncbi:hypothetical protein N7467_005227 [Penicillium canescens]|nr:hypothetical protein N7467_005227 [Penicillium canescens]